MLFAQKITKTKKPDLFVNLEHITEIFSEEGNSDQLFILIHGWKHSADDLKSVGKFILEHSQFQKATVVIPELKTKSFLSSSNIYIIVRDIVFLIDNLDKGDKFKKIYLIGHSAGALIARKVYLCAYGEILDEKAPEKTPKAPFESIIKTGKDKTQKNKEFTEEPLKLGTQKNWVKKVDRIILLAGTNMGWTASPAFRWLFLLATDAGIVLDTILNRITQKLFIFRIRRGSSFITNLRFQWLIMSQEIKFNNQINLHQPEKEVLVIQLLGNQDNIVSPQDNIDYVTGQHFYYKDVPETNHKNIIKLNVTNTTRDSIFKEALTYVPENDRSKSFLTIKDLYDRDFIPENRDIKNVVFVIHGIRDEGFWTNRVARRIKQEANNLGEKVTWASETSTYGYFGMLPFLFPYLRYQKVEWLMDKYIENRSLYPEADFHYVGHSNGTYLVAQALEKYSYCRFKHIVFAGSVVQSRYDWQKRINKKQVAQFLNFVATADCIVAIFPNLFDCYPWNNLGGAGHKGFKIDEPLDTHDDTTFHYQHNSEETIHQLRYIKGYHGAATKEDNWELIANFIIEGKEALNKKTLQTKNFEKNRNLLIAILGLFPYAIWLIILLLIIAIGWFLIVIIPSLLLHSITNRNIVELLLRLSGIIFILYLSLIWRILTRI